MAPKKTSKRSDDATESNKRVINDSVKKQEAAEVQAMLNKNKARKTTATIFKPARRIKKLRPIIISDDDELEHQQNTTDMHDMRNVHQVRTCERVAQVHRNHIFL